LNCLDGKILRVNLTTSKISTEPTIKYAKKFLGGRGINQWILYNEVKTWCRPLEPCNRLIFGTGLLVGTPVPGANRYNVDAKNAFTMGIGSANSGGFFGPELRFAGYDHIVIHGRAKKPVYLWIDDDKVEIRNASGIWGSTTWETEDLIRESIGDEDIQIASIGPAGENLVRAACIITDRSRAAARCGLGAVMGSKNLKAVAVRGSGSVEVADPEGFIALVDEAFEKIKKSTYTKMLGKYGSHYIMPNDFSLMPMRNFQDGYMDPNKLKKVSSEVFHSEYEERTLSGFACPIHCNHFYRVKQGPYSGVTSWAFEGNGLWDFACRFDIDYAPAIIKAASLCSQYGLDMDNVSNVIAWAFECYERRILTEKDTDGYELKWGDHKVVIEFLKKIAYREGFGDILAEGCKRASKAVGRGSEKYCMNIKGQDLKEPLRTCKGYALGIVVSTRGGGHCSGSIETELMRAPPEICKKIWKTATAGDPAVYKGKAKVVVYYERLHGVLNSLGVCFFTSIWETLDLLKPNDYAKLLSAATGWKITGSELMMIGERIHNVEKAFNVLHAGFSRKDDYPPKRFMEEPVKSGPLRGELLEKSKWDEMINEYYELHNWDGKTGLQTRKCLIDLDLVEIANNLKKSHKLVENI